MGDGLEISTMILFLKNQNNIILIKKIKRLKIKILFNLFKISLNFL
jgi:hypothetical protein